MTLVRVAAAQLDLVVGDLEGNLARLLDAYARAEEAGCDLVAFPELAVTGYPPEDLLLRPAFVAQAAEALGKLAARTGRTAAVVGFPDAGHDLANAAAVCAGGKLQGVYRKRLLPNYSVFDERRYFVPGTADGPLFVIGGVRVAVSVCEDAWSPGGPLTAQAAGGAELAVNISASPFHAGRQPEREAMLSTRAADAGIPLVYVNLVGGQDELVFDGASMVFDEWGHLVARAAAFSEELLVVDLDVNPGYRHRLLDPRGRASGPALPQVSVSGAGSPRRSVGERIAPALEPVAEVYEALVLGTRDYARKNGFERAVLGLSGGVDSALVATVAVDALGPESVVGVLMPSRFTSEASGADAAALASNLGVETMTLPIEDAHAAFLRILDGPFRGGDPGVAGENVQARVRGVLLMALSNRFGWLVLTTGNKSEMATGYATLYGDMAGGFAVLKDVPKTLVYALVEERNARAGHDLIPRAVVEKAPSAELRPDQRDADSLPPYPVLDPVLERYVEGDESVAEIEADGYDSELVRRIARLVDTNEYKRRQAPPGVRVSPKAFGKDRRLPITNLWPG